MLSFTCALLWCYNLPDCHCWYFSLGPAILEDVLIEVFRTLYTQCKTELELQAEPSFNKDHTQLSRWMIRGTYSVFKKKKPFCVWKHAVSRPWLQSVRDCDLVFFLIWVPLIAIATSVICAKVCGDIAFFFFLFFPIFRMNLLLFFFLWQKSLLGTAEIQYVAGLYYRIKLKIEV